MHVYYLHAAAPIQIPSKLQPGKCSETKDNLQLDTLDVRGLPTDMSKDDTRELLEDYFSNPDSGGKQNALVDVKFLPEKGRALITFSSDAGM